MKTPREKYMNDPQYHNLVTMLEKFIDQAQFTPSELREAVVLACINYEMRNIQGQAIDPRLMDALDTLDKFTTRNTRQR